MPSQSLKHWNDAAATALDRMELAHGAIGGTRRGRRYATQQINQSYLVLLSSHFQQFCRSLHSETAAHLTNAIDPVLRPIMQGALTAGRRLDRGNPTPGHLGEDFGRFGLDLWRTANTLRATNAARARTLEQMGHWRNAIAHQDFTPQSLRGRTEITLIEVRRFRAVCRRLASDFDTVLLAHIKAVAGPNAGW